MLQQIGVVLVWGGANNYVLLGSYASPYAAFSMNNGNNWSYASTSAISSSIFGIAFTPNYAIVGGSTIWRTNLTSFGNWSVSSTGWPLNSWVNCMKSINPNLVLAGGSNGVYASTDQGATWIDFNNGLDYRVANDVEENFGLLYLATNNGLWMSPVPVNSSIQENPNSSGLHEIEVYPNPARDLISVHWNPLIKYSTLEVINGLGSFLHSVHIGSTNQISLDVSGLPAGVYIIKLSDGERHSFGKLMVH